MILWLPLYREMMLFFSSHQKAFFMYAVFSLHLLKGVISDNENISSRGLTANQSEGHVEKSNEEPSQPSEPSEPPEAESRTNNERRLVDYILRDYDKNIRPVKDANDPVVIRLGITLTQIFDLDEKNQVLTTNVWLDQEWQDDFLTWEVEAFGNLTKVRIPCEKIWLPDIVLYNSADDYTRGYMRSRAMIEPTGLVFWPPPTKFRSTCPVDVTYFPFDDQTCIMKFGSWIYDGLQVDLHNRSSEVDMSNYVANGEWDLLQARIVRNVVFYTCCIEPFPDVTVTIIIRRKTLYYMYNVVLPCMMMSVLTLLVFCLPPDSGEKIALGVTVLLAFSVFMLAISEKLPETSESIPLLGIYLTAVMAITSVSVIMTVIVLNFHYRGPIRKEMPKWLKKLVLDNNLVDNVIQVQPSSSRFLLDKVVEHNSSKFCPPPAASASRQPNQGNWSWFPEFSANSAAYPPSANQPSSATSSFSSHLIKSAADAGLRGVAIDSSFICQPEEKEDLIGMTEFGESSDTLNNITSNRKECRNKKRSFPRPGQTSSGKTSGIGGNSGAGVGSGAPGNKPGTPQEEMLKILRYLLWRQELEDQYNKMVHEWRLLALAIDKVLFWVFLVITVVSSLSFLVIIPIQRRGFGFGFG